MTRVEKFRKARGWERSDLAEYLDRTYNTVKRWELGLVETPRSIIMLLDYVDKYGIIHKTK